MIYIAAGCNDYQSNISNLQENIDRCIKAYRPIKNQVTFILDDFGDEILEYCDGLEDYRYFYSRGESIFSQLHDLRFDIEPGSLIVEEAKIDPKIIISFYQQAQRTQVRSDFLRLQDEKRIYGVYYFGNSLYNKLWSIANGQNLKATHFSWQSLPMDVCINPSKIISKSYTKDLG